MEKDKIEIFGRKYQFITRAEADKLEDLRIQSFIGTIDANTCERECYLSIFTDNVLDDQRDISGLIKKINHPDECGAIWVANHQKQTLTYDGIRSMRTIHVLKQIGGADYPCLISREEYENFIKYYSKFFGAFFNRIEGVDCIISQDEFESAKQTVKEYNKQETKRKKARKPQLGDFVIVLSQYPGRYIGQGQALFKTEYIERDLVDMEDDWTDLPEPHLLPTDTELINYIRDNSWNTND